MTLHEVCKECRWNKYPDCLGTIMEDGDYMKIDSLKPAFKCGQKEIEIAMDFSIKKKTDLELKVEELDERLAIVEAKVPKEEKP